MVTGVTTQVPIIVFALCKDGRRVPTQVTTAPIHNEAGEVIGGVETFRDVTLMLVDLERAKRIQSQSMKNKIPDDPLEAAFAQALDALRRGYDEITVAS